MKRLICILLAVMLTVLLCACEKTQAPAEAPVSTSEPAVTPVPPTDTPEPTPELTEPPAPSGLVISPPPEGWAEPYIDFLDNNYDIIAALWPEGLSGVGFIDLDLDGMPEMILFDLGASATLGVQIFDQIDGGVYCISSVMDSAAGAFGDTYFSPVSVCASFFESFRLSETEDGYCFWVDSANGTAESSWDEIVRFESNDGVLTPVSICERYLESDTETGLVVAERYSAGGEEIDADGYAAAEDAYTGARDTGYEARGVFLWNDMARYDTTYDGLLTMARDGVEAYVPIAVD